MSELNKFMVIKRPTLKDDYFLVSIGGDSKIFLDVIKAHYPNVVIRKQDASWDQPLIKFSLADLKQMMSNAVIQQFLLDVITQIDIGFIKYLKLLSEDNDEFVTIIASITCNTEGYNTSNFHKLRTKLLNGDDFAPKAEFILYPNIIRYMIENCGRPIVGDVIQSQEGGIEITQEMSSTRIEISFYCETFKHELKELLMLFGNSITDIKLTAGVDKRLLFEINSVEEIVDYVRSFEKGKTPRNGNATK